MRTSGAARKIAAAIGAIVSNTCSQLSKNQQQLLPLEPRRNRLIDPAALLLAHPKDRRTVTTRQPTGLDTSGCLDIISTMALSKKRASASNQIALADELLAKFIRGLGDPTRLQIFR